MFVNYVKQNLKQLDYMANVMRYQNKQDRPAPSMILHWLQVQLSMALLQIKFI